MARESYYHVGPKVPESYYVKSASVGCQASVVRECLGGRCNDGGCRVSLPSTEEQGKKGGNEEG